MSFMHFMQSLQLCNIYFLSQLYALLLTKETNDIVLALPRQNGHDFQRFREQTGSLGLGVTIGTFSSTYLLY